MEEVCDFIRSYMNGNALELDFRCIRTTSNEDFITTEDEKEYILSHLSRIEGVSSIEEDEEGNPYNTVVVNLKIAEHLLINVGIGMVIDSSLNNNWNVEVETIII